MRASGPTTTPPTTILPTTRRTTTTSSSEELAEKSRVSPCPFSRVQALRDAVLQVALNFVTGILTEWVVWPLWKLVMEFNIRGADCYCCCRGCCFNPQYWGMGQWELERRAAMKDKKGRVRDELEKDEATPPVLVEEEAVAAPALPSP